MDKDSSDNYCSNCGMPLSTGAKFCSKCGKQIETAFQNSMLTKPKGKMKKGVFIAIGIGVIILLLGGIVFFQSSEGKKATSGEITMKKASETVISLASNTVSVDYENSRIIIPGNTVQKEEKLVISKVSGTPKAMEGLTELCAPFDVKLGGIKEFKNPILIEIPYDQGKLGGLSPEDAFVAVYYNESVEKWIDVPYKTDVSRRVVQLQMYHLTTVQCYYSYWEGARVYDNGSALVIFDLGEEARKAYAKYEQDTGKTAVDPTRPQMVVDAADNAKRIIKAYRDAGLTITGKPKIYFSKKNNYNSASGNVALDITVTFSDDNPEKMIARNLAHELFHKAQQDTLGSYAYNKTIYTNTSFWMEATADYMGNKGVWLLLGEAPVNKFEIYGMDFFEKELYALDGSHEYAAADFVDFVLTKQNVSPLQLVKLAEESSVLSGLNFENRFNAVFKNASYSGLSSYYGGFVEYALFDNKSRYMQSSNGRMEGAFARLTELKFEPNTAGTATKQVLEGKEEIRIPDDYTAGFYRFTTDMDTTLEITCEAPLVMYSANRIRTDRGFTRCVAASVGVPAKISFSKDEFVVLVATGGTQKSFDIKYKAMPLTVSARSVQGVVPLKFRFPNGKIPPATAENVGWKIAVQKWAEAKKYDFVIQHLSHSGIYEDADYYYRIDRLDPVNREDFRLKTDNDGKLFVQGDVNIEYLIMPQHRATHERITKTVLLKAELTQNNEGYDVKLEIDGVISEGKLK